MFVHEVSGEHIYTGDVVSLKHGNEAVVKIIKFFTQAKVGYYIRVEASRLCHSQEHETPLLWLQWCAYAHL